MDQGVGYSLSNPEKEMSLRKWHKPPRDWENAIQVVTDIHPRHESYSKQAQINDFRTQQTDKTRPYSAQDERARKVRISLATGQNRWQQQIPPSSYSAIYPWKALQRDSPRKNLRSISTRTSFSSFQSANSMQSLSVKSSFSSLRSLKYPSNINFQIVTGRKNS
ncbi:hypothetical protein HI914_03765 [Erysiphe necator]|nr:hypothetical protein HI914_03765 [Erysiphe necator]